MASSRHLHRCQPREVAAPFSSSPSRPQLGGPRSPCQSPSAARWQVGWADMYPIMGYSGPIRIGPSIGIISIFFRYSLDMYPRRIGYVSISDTYPTRIRIPGDVSVLHRLTSAVTMSKVIYHRQQKSEFQVSAHVCHMVESYPIS
jgi:hypothetical protein